VFIGGKCRDFVSEDSDLNIQKFVIEQDRNFTYNVILRRVHVTTVALEISISIKH
jgi:hypothetical protein